MAPGDRLMARWNSADIEAYRSRRAAWAEEWRAVAADTRPADRARAEAAVRAEYVASGRPAPEIRWAASPRSAMLAWSFLTGSHRQLINPYARGDIGNGDNRDFNGLPDPFGFEPAWVRRLEARIDQGLASIAQASGEQPAAAPRELGLAPVGRPLTTLRSVLPSTFVEADVKVVPDPAAVDAASGVLGELWPIVVRTLGEASAREAFADAVSKVAAQTLNSMPLRRDAVQAMQAGQWDARTPLLAAVRDVFDDPLWRHRKGRTERVAAIDRKLEIARSTGPWWALADIAVLSERPLVAHLDDEGRPHSMEGPALAWGDGFEVYAVHGVVLEREVILDPAGIKPEDINAEGNIERRRVLVDLFGPERLVREGGAKLVHEDETGRLWRRDLDRGRPPWQRRDEPVVLVEVKNSTPEPDGSVRTYFLRVPPTTSTAVPASPGRSASVRWSTTRRPSHDEQDKEWQTTDLGMQAVDRIHGEMQIDEPWTLRRAIANTPAGQRAAVNRSSSTAPTTTVGRKPRAG